MMDKVINAAGEIEKAGCVVIDDDMNVLIVNEPSKLNYGLPKGHVERGEDFQRAAARETLEETGWEVQILHQLSDTTYTNEKTKMPIRVHWFLALPIEQVSEPEEIPEWMTHGEAEKIVRENLVPILREAYDSLTG